MTPNPHPVVKLISSLVSNAPEKTEKLKRMSEPFLQYMTAEEKVELQKIFRDGMMTKLHREVMSYVITSSGNHDRD